VGRDGVDELGVDRVIESVVGEDDLVLEDVAGVSEPPLRSVADFCGSTFGV
jgi:hypothetical protein